MAHQSAQPIHNQGHHPIAITSLAFIKCVVFIIEDYFLKVYRPCKNLIFSRLFLKNRTLGMCIIKLEVAFMTNVVSRV